MLGYCDDCRFLDEGLITLRCWSTVLLEFPSLGCPYFAFDDETLSLRLSKETDSLIPLCCIP